jgi:catalase
VRLKSNAGQEIEIERKEAEKKAQKRHKEFKKLEEEQEKERRLKAKNKHLKTVKEVYLSSLNEQQKQPLFDELKGKYEAEHGECGLIKDLNSGFILG